MNAKNFSFLQCWTKKISVFIQIQSWHEGLSRLLTANGTTKHSSPIVKFHTATKLKAINADILLMRGRNGSQECSRLSLPDHCRGEGQRGFCFLNSGCQFGTEEEIQNKGEAAAEDYRPINAACASRRRGGGKETRRKERGHLVKGIYFYYGKSSLSVHCSAFATSVLIICRGEGSGVFGTFGVKSIIY